MYTVANCLGKDKNAAAANIHTLMPHVANTAVVTKKQDLSGQLSSERQGRRTVAWNGTETCDQCYFKTTFADNTCKTAILHVCLFKFLSTRTTTVLEGTSRRMVSCQTYASQVTDHALKVAQFSKKCTGSNNRKSNPKTPNDATKNGDNFVTEKLGDIMISIWQARNSAGVTHRRKRYDEEDGYRNRPPSWKTSKVGDRDQKEQSRNEEKGGSEMRCK
jgi:hypothetical protein